MNKPNQKQAITKAGHSVDSKADSDVDVPTSPPISWDESDDAFPREEPTLGSLFGF